MSEETRVRMYTISTCGFCKAAKAFLREHGIPFEFVDIDLLEQDEKRRVLKEARAVTGVDRIAFPTIVIGDTVIIGFKEYEIRKALGL
ncbi:MAG TPA: glutaredoxin family protein [Candidatus Eisenbacteria bacterium]|uniref:Glutaredoxin family protein n=1 Tax=Eiseniibacteriota bacterium TaxID=2212470 RepID=A0A7V2ATC7_UNCEI|nr:glutaredoxin family protein [Candidatus Eisenbacteria bacterium]